MTRPRRVATARLPRSLREAGKPALNRLFRLGQRVGLDILPRHFYSEIPSVAELRAGRAWREPRSMAGIAGTELAGQLAFVRSCCPPDVVAQATTSVYERACAENGAVGYGLIESQLLFCFVASQRPRRIVQVGCGVSTSVILQAARAAGHRVQVVCVEPYPTPFLAARAAAGELELISDRAQDVPLRTLTTLEAGDLLFIDSTHTVKPGSEVNRVVLDVLPRLGAGVYVHFHDILFPYDYSPTILTDVFFWSESVLLQAFLTQNPRYAIRAALSMLHHGDPDGLHAILPSYRPAHFAGGLLTARGADEQFPSAAYLQVVEG